MSYCQQILQLTPSRSTFSSEKKLQGPNGLQNTASSATKPR